MPLRRIAYLSLEAPREGRAVFTHVNEINAGLRRRHFAVDLFSPRYANEERSPGVLGRLFEYAAIQLRLMRRLRQYDLLYLRSHFMAFPTAALARLVGVPTVHEVNGHYVDIMITYPWTRRFGAFLRFLQRQQYRRAQALVAVTPQLRDFLRAEGCTQTIEVIPNGANTEFFNPGRERAAGLPSSYVVFFGGFTRWQGIPVMLQAIEHPDWPSESTLVMVGGGQMRPEVEAAAIASKRLRYLGELPYEQVGSVVAGAFAGLVMSTDRNATGVFPLKLFEIMASGVTPIVADFPGQADLVRSEECGLVIPPGDPAALARAVAAIAADPEKWCPARARAHRAIVERHTWDQRAGQTAELISRVLRFSITPESS